MNPSSDVSLMKNLILYRLRVFGEQEDLVLRKHTVYLNIPSSSCQWV